MRTVNVDTDSLVGHSTQTQTLSTEPVPMLDFMKVAIERKQVVEGILNDKLGEDTDTTSNSPTGKTKSTKHIDWVHLNISASCFKRRMISSSSSSHTEVKCEFFFL